MVASSHVAATAAGLASGVICALGASKAFLNSPAPGTGNLRAAGARTAPQKLHAEGAAPSSTSFWAACSGGCMLAAAGAAMTRRSRAARSAAKGKELAKPDMNIPRPEDLLESPKFPLFMGSTGGYMSKATRERHAITWTAKESVRFVMPTGGNTAVMNKGENLCYFRKKEQCIALGKELRKMKIENYKIYRLAKDGTVTFLHPADGVFPEKVNKGRVQVNGRPWSIGQNPQPGALKWTKYNGKSYEADPLTSMFVKARLKAFLDQENLFPLPNPWGTIEAEDEEEYLKQLQAKLKSI